MLVEFKNGDLLFNWHKIPDEKLRNNFILRDKVFLALKKEFGENAVVCSKILYQMNKYAIDIIKLNKK